VTLRLHSVCDSVPLSDIKTAPSCPSYNEDKYCYPGDAHQEVQTKTVCFDESKVLIDEVDELSWRISHLNVHDSAYAGCYAHLICLSTAAAEIWPLPAGARPCATPVHQTFSTTSSTAMAPPSSNCFMCGGQHLISQCPVVEDYICAGRIVRRDQFLAYPDGSHICHHHGMGLLCTTIDERYGNTLPVQASTSDALPTTSNFRCDPLPHISSTTYTATDPDPATYVFQCVPIVENNMVITDIEEEVDVCAITRSKVKVKEEGEPTQGKGNSTQKGEETVKSHEWIPSNEPSSSLNKRTPAYTYEFKAMNPAVTKQTF